jgi:hypothetical protein
LTKNLERSVRRWLAHEAAGRTDDAETELARALELLPPPVPLPGFRQRVLARVRAAGALPPAPGGWHWGFKVAAALCLALGGLSAGVLPALAGALVGGLTFGEALLRGVHLVAGLFRWTVDGLAVWRTVSSFGHAVGMVATTPEVVTGMLVSLVVGIGALSLLYYLMSYERSSVYV